MRTRWGQSQPLRKCAVLSLFCHLLLAVYATTVQIVAASAGPGPRDAIRVGFVDADDASDQKLGAGDETAKPWNKFAAETSTLPDAGAPAVPIPRFPTSRPPRRPKTRRPTPRKRSTLRRQRRRPSLNRRFADTQTTSAAPAETIEAPTAKSTDTSDDAASDLETTDRVAPPSTRTNNVATNDAATPDDTNNLTDPITELPTDVAIKPGDCVGLPRQQIAGTHRRHARPARRQPNGIFRHCQLRRIEPAAQTASASAPAPATATRPENRRRSTATAPARTAAL